MEAFPFLDLPRLGDLEKMEVPRGELRRDGKFAGELQGKVGTEPEPVLGTGFWLAALTGQIDRP